MSDPLLLTVCRDEDGDLIVTDQDGRKIKYLKAVEVSGGPREDFISATIEVHAAVEMSEEY